MPGTSSSQKSAEPSPAAPAAPCPSPRPRPDLRRGSRDPRRSLAARGARNLLFLLLISPRYSLPRDRVLDLLWPESSPEAASNALYKALHALRRVLEPELRTGRGSSYIATDGDLIRVKPHDGLWVDTIAFEQGLSQAAAQPPEQRRTLLARSPFPLWRRPAQRRPLHRMALRPARSLTPRPRTGHARSRRARPGLR